jgi:hypothetical protein
VAISGKTTEHRNRENKPNPLPVGFANSGGLVFVDESAEEVAAV